MCGSLGKIERSFDAKLEQRVRLFVLLGLFKEEICRFLVKFGHSLRRQIGVLGQQKRICKCVDQILIALTHELVHNFGHARCRVLNLAHHSDQLTDDDRPIDTALHLGQAVLKHFHSAIVHDKVAVAPIF